jgi:ABC1 atypical kinase-like domain
LRATLAGESILAYVASVPLQITRLGDRIGKLSPMQRKLGIRRILGAVSEAYGRMMLYEGLFQADGHPGNILVMKGKNC